jgi:Pro-kumamolisin, activation domain
MTATRPESNTLNDRGPVSPDLQFDHMWLLLKRPAELEATLEQFIEDQHNPKSASFPQWLSAAQFGERYGVASR